MYLWLKAAHIVAVISWMAGMLYPPRLFVYHADTPAGSDKSETFKVMEYRLYRFIMTPAMIATWVFGLWLAYVSQSFGAHWLHAKLMVVLILSALHGLFGSAVRRFAQDKNRRPARFYRIVNEIPTVIMIVIVVLAVVKPF
jgi:protoporphyrinogen IX oxidase